jgi:transposase
MVSARSSHLLANPWVSLVPSLVCKPLVTSEGASAPPADPVEEFAFCFHDSGRPSGQALHSSETNMPKPTAKKARSRRAKASKTNQSQPLLRPHAAGVDVGATQLYVAVPADSDPEPVRTFGTFTDDLHALADWLVRCKVETVAMESTGVYWIPLFQVLEARGLEVCLVNARHVKNVPGRKTDVSDCQWLQYLHSVGLLRASFRPPAQVCALRSLWRHRDTLIRYAASHVQHLQKALTQMNLQLANVISDITGKTGLAIIDAILDGERDGAKLAALRDHRIKASADTIAKSLRGDWRLEHLFTLGQARQIYAHYQQMIAACDQEIAAYLRQFESRIDPAQHPLPPPTTRHVQPQRNQPGFDLRSELYRILGVDLTQVPGLQSPTISVFLSEIGATVERFASPKHFASWLGLCPDNRITGGRILSARTRDVKSRTAYALRMAAQNLQRSQSALGDYYRRMKARLGAPAAITAAAHKLARIIHHLIKHRCPYDASAFAKQEELHRLRREKHLRKQATLFGFQLTPLQGNS